MQRNLINAAIVENETKFYIFAFLSVLEGVIFYGFSYGFVSKLFEVNVID